MGILIIMILIYNIEFDNSKITRGDHHFLNNIYINKTHNSNLHLQVICQYCLINQLDRYSFSNNYSCNIIINIIKIFDECHY